MPGDSELGDATDRGAKYRVHLCFGPNCTERGSRALMPVLQRAVDEAGLGDAVEVLATTCRNRCEDGPSLNVYPGPVFYNCLDEEAIQRIVTDHLAGDSVVRQWLYRPRIESGKQRVGSAALDFERRRA